MGEATRTEQVWAEQAEPGAGMGHVALPTALAPSPQPSRRERRDFSALERLVLCKNSDPEVGTSLFHQRTCPKGEHDPGLL